MMPNISFKWSRLRRPVLVFFLSLIYWSGFIGLASYGVSERTPAELYGGMILVLLLTSLFRWFAEVTYNRLLGVDDDRKQEGVNR